MTVLRGVASNDSGSELVLHNDAVSVCIVANRRARTLRVIDYRNGPSSAKLLLMTSVAQRHHAEKLFAIVEREELAPWTTMGFVREGTIPGYFRRTDGIFVGLDVNPERPSHGSHARIKLGVSPLECAERSIAEAKSLRDEISKPGPLARLVPMPHADAMGYIRSLSSTSILSAGEPFGRDGDRSFFAVRSRGRWDAVFSVEQQPCYGNAHVALVGAPRSHHELVAARVGLSYLIEELSSRGIVSCFGLSASDDVALAALFLAAGFRQSGLLRRHQYVRGLRRDALLWTVRLG